MHEKEKCLSRLNGFFAFCIYDKQEQTFFVARDRFGAPPLKCGNPLERRAVEGESRVGEQRQNRANFIANRFAERHDLR